MASLLRILIAMLMIPPTAQAMKPENIAFMNLSPFGSQEIQSIRIHTLTQLYTSEQDINDNEGFTLISDEGIEEEEEEFTIITDCGVVPIGTQITKYPYGLIIFDFNDTTTVTVNPRHETISIMKRDQITKLNSSIGLKNVLASLKINQAIKSKK